MAEKVEGLLASLRGEEPEPELQAPEETPLEPPPMELAAPAADLGPIEEKIAALEAKLEELAARSLEPPALELPPPLEEPPPEPPEPPTQLTMFLQTRMELLERKLEMAQNDALRSNMILREREDAQRKAQKEVEDLFHRIREQQRASGFDRELRRNYADARARVDDLQQRLTLSQLRMVPAEDVLRAFEGEDGRKELERRIRLQLAKAQAQEPVADEGTGPPTAPSVEMQQAPITGDIGSITVLLGKISDLEGRLEESEAAREKERSSRRVWEEQMLVSLQATRRQWEKAGGPELLVEASLESMVDSMKERDRIQVELGRLVEMLRDEPADSQRVAPMRARMAEYQRKIDELQEKLGKQMSLIEAWVRRGRSSE